MSFVEACGAGYVPTQQRMASASLDETRVGYQAAREAGHIGVVGQFCNMAARALRLELQLAVVRDDAAQAAELVSCGADIDGLCRCRKGADRICLDGSVDSRAPPLTLLQLAQALDSRAVLAVCPQHTARDSRIREVVVEQSTEAALRELYRAAPKSAPRWQFEQSHNKWCDFGEGDQDALASADYAHAESVTIQHRDGSGYHSRRVDLRTLVQTNLATKKERRVRRHWESEAAQRKAEEAQSKRLHKLDVARTIVQVHREWLQRSSSTQVSTCGMRSGIPSSEPPRCTGAQCVSTDCPQGRLMSFACEWRSVLNQSSTMVVRTDAQDAGNWNWHVPMSGGFRSEPEPVKTRLHTKCVNCEAPTTNIRYRPRSTLGDLQLSRQGMEDSHPDRTCLCGECFRSMQQEVPRFRGFPNDPQAEMYCTNGERVPAQEEMEAWFYPPPIEHQTGQRTGGKQQQASKKGRKVRQAEKALKDVAQKQLTRDHSSDPLSEQALQECRDCFRPFAPQSSQGRVTEHYCCTTCNERVCSFCRGQPADPYLIFALQRLSLAKFAHDRLIENSCVVYLDFDVIEQSLATLVWTGCFNLGVLLEPVKRMATLVEELDIQGALPDSGQSDKLADALPAGTLVSVGPVECYQASSLFECDNAHALPQSATGRNSCDYCGCRLQTFQCLSCAFQICERCALMTRIKPGDSCEVDGADGVVIKVQPSRGVKVSSSCVDGCRQDSESSQPNFEYLKRDWRGMHHHHYTCPNRGAENDGEPEPSIVTVSLLCDSVIGRQVELNWEDERFHLKREARCLRKLTRDTCVPTLSAQDYRSHRNHNTRARMHTISMDDFVDAELLVDADADVVYPLSPVAYEMCVAESTRRSQPLLQQAISEQKEKNKHNDIRQEMMRGICWGGDTWVFVSDGRRYIRLRDVDVGDRVLTADGTTYRAVARVWVTDYSDPKRNTEMCFYRGVWMTSHHPVLLGQDWRYPADLVESHPATQIVKTVGAMYNLELSGHLDTVVLCGGTNTPVWPPLASCTVGKYLGRSFGFGLWTRRSTRCARNCSQCDSVFSANFNPTTVQPSMRWATFPAFVEVEYPDAQRANFWPENAARVWKAAGLPEVCEESHSSARVDLRLRGGQLIQQRTSTGLPWRTAMLGALDKRVMEGKQQLTDRTLKSLLEHHDVRPATTTTTTNAQKQCPRPSEACAPTNTMATNTAVGQIGSTSSAIYDIALSKNLNSGQRGAYVKMQRRRAVRDAAAAAAEATAADDGLSVNTAVCCSEAKHAAVAAGKTRCFLCLESFTTRSHNCELNDAPELIRPCKAESCGAVACARCWERYLELTIGVNTSRFACPTIPCFACQAVLPTKEWADSSEAARRVSVEYACRAAQLMTVHCATCEHTDTILPQFDEASSGGLLSAVNLAGFEMAHLREAEAAWLQYEHGAATQLARQLLTLPLDTAQLHMALCAVHDVERRLALQLALLSIDPIVSAGLLGCDCVDATCFKCKHRANYGRGSLSKCACSASISCLAVASEEERSRQRCSACGVQAPTRDLSCASVLCICGKYYETTP